MSADHYDFVFQIGIGSRNFGDGIESVLVIAKVFHVDIQFDVDRHIRLEQPKHTSIVLDRHHDHWHGIRMLAFVGGPAQAAIVEDRAAGAAVVASIAAGKNYRQRHAPPPETSRSYRAASSA